LFGKMEVVNRIYFVKKYRELSLMRCYLTLLARTWISIGMGIVNGEKGYFKRAWGNFTGMSEAILKYRNQEQNKALQTTKVTFQTCRRKRVVILASAIGPMDRGIGQYERHLLPHLLPSLASRGCQVLVVLSKDATPLPSIDGIKYVRLPISRGKSALRLFTEQILLPYVCLNTDIFLSLESVFPITPITARRKLTVVHDIHVVRHSDRPKQYPEDYTWQYKTYANLATRKAVASSDCVITVSKFTGDEVQHVFGVPSNRIVVIGNGVDHQHFRLIEDPIIIERVRKRYMLPSSYYLFVGPYSKKKNLQLIVEAYASEELLPDVFLPVVVVGDTRRNRLYTNTLSLIKQTHKEELFRFLGFVPQGDMPALYASARALIYPSLYEGFGLPALEAMACGTPVIASNQSSIPEVVNGAALLIDPLQPKSLIDALRKLNNEHTRIDLIEKGLKRAQEFSWEKTADLMLETIID